MFKLLKTLKYLNNIRKYCNNKAKGKNALYSHTVLLPKTKFPLRIEGKKLVDRDNAINKSSSFVNLYNWQRNNLKGDEFILHDGPPYANGETHMGHAINKILKDTIIRSNILEGRKVHYVPGWDCHGLPIELKAVSNSQGLKPIKIREKARKFATTTIETQKKSFMSWGVCADWENPYKTFNNEYIKNQIQQFYKLYEMKLVYRDVKPVYWSPSTRTALAEAELEYKDNHKSTAIIIKLKLNQIPDVLKEHKNIFALIWTTTPWTLPSNQAVCYNPNLSYSLVQNQTSLEHYILSTKLIEDVSKKLGSELTVLNTFQGSAFENTTYFHPIYKNKELSFLPSNHASETKGTGLVHTAPAHGPDDFLVALKNNLQIISLVDEDGKYLDSAGSELTQKYVFAEGLDTVLNMTKSDTLNTEDFIHSYPYDWRTKLPVIIRASKQWFIDTNRIKQQAVDALSNVEILPKINSEMHKQHFKNQLLKRPYWCISRQRCWGVPIPVFYNKESEDVIISKDTINHFCNLIDKHGSNFWWSLPEKDIVPESILKKQSNIKKGEDILDIWFDSGISWSSVLPKDKIADIYLEGVDQFTGWFQSSLLTSIALQEKAPFKTIYVHGFAVDENGLKMSKSLGNVINPQDILEGCKSHKAYGIDTLRWWVACHANQDTITEVSSNVLQASNDEVQKIRSVLRFALSTLSDYNGEIVDYESLCLIDKFMLHVLLQYDRQVTEHLKFYQFNKIGKSIINLLTNTVSAQYYTAVKDRLYCEPENSISRRSSQFVLLNLFLITLRSISPIVPHLAEELYLHFPLKQADSFFQTEKARVDPKWESLEIENVMNVIFDLKKEVNKTVGANTVNKRIVIGLDEELKKEVEKYTLGNGELLDILQVAEIELNTKLDGTSIEVHDTKLCCCPRCRKFASSMSDALCKRCNEVINGLENKAQHVL
ncbi:isoleucine--tRNA ligase, mitochondrial isoform X1 [Onthophagus taurus]|uniref:isoleucine--tRNA ligase, mitochondrial isoform X1 n=1 Tax=Onthophagus taurus TaxID=166361 RepID=UPI0039BEAC06